MYVCHQKTLTWEVGHGADTSLKWAKLPHPLYPVLHAPEFNSFNHIKNDWNIVKMLDLILTH